MTEEVIIPAGIKIGSCNDDYTGVTVIMCEKGAVAGADVRGGAPGTRETDLLKPEKAMEKINAVVLAGGSAYGLASTCGVMEYMRERGIGYKIGKKVVPIVCGAVIFDLNDKDYHYPTAEWGYKACKAASDKNVPFGQVGVGKGATVGKIRGLAHAQKSGLGAATVKAGGCVVTAVVAVNALGDITDGKGNILAGAADNKGGFIGTERCLREGKWFTLLTGANTTIGCVMTNAKLTKVEANKLASITHNAYAKHISPVHTDFDGDTIFTMNTGVRRPYNFLLLQVAAVEAMGRAIMNAASGASYKINYSEESAEGGGEQQEESAENGEE